MQLIPRPSRYWSLRFDSSSTGTSAKFTNSDQGQIGQFPVYVDQFDNNVIHTINPRNKYLDYYGYSCLDFNYDPIRIYTTATTWTVQSTVTKESTVKCGYGNTLPPLGGLWTINFWMLNDWMVNKDLQIIFMNGKFAQAQGDFSAKPYFQYALYTVNDTINFSVFNKDGSIQSTATLSVTPTLNSNFTWFNVTVSCNTDTITLSVKNGDAIYSWTPFVYSQSTSTSYFTDDVHLNLATILDNSNIITSFGCLRNSQRGNTRPELLGVPHGIAKQYWPFGVNYTHYYHGSFYGTPNEFYTPLDTTAYENYGVCKSVKLAHLSVWYDKVYETSDLIDQEFPFGQIAGVSDVFVGDSVQLVFGKFYRMSDSVLVSDSTALSSKFYTLGHNIAVADSLTVDAPFYFNLVDNISVSSVSNSPKIPKFNMVHTVKVVDQTNCNIKYFNLTDGVSVSDTFIRRGTIRINIVENLGVSDVEAEKRPIQLTATNIVRPSDSLRINLAYYEFITEVLVSDTIDKRGPINFSLKDSVKTIDSLKLNKILQLDLISCLIVKHSGNKAIELEADNTVQVTQSSTNSKVFSLVSSVAVTQQVIPSDIDYTDLCQTGLVKANTKALSNSLVVGQSVGIVSGVTYLLGNDLTITDRVVGFLIRTKGYNPYSGAL